MSGTITTGNAPRLLLEGLESIFGSEYNEREMLWRRVFEDKGSTKAYEVLAQMEGFGLASEKPEGQEVQFDTRRQGFVPKFIATTIAKGFVVTEEAQEDDLYSQAQRDTMSLARSMRVTEETVSFNILNRAFDANYTMPGGDGKSLLANDHQLGPTNTGTYSNVAAVAAAFSEASLEDMLIQIDRAKDARGLPIQLTPDLIVGASENRFEFERVMGSVLQNDTANNALNAAKSLGAVRNGWITTPYLIGNAWFIKTDSMDGLCSFNRIPLSFGEDNSFTTGNLRYKARQRYSKGWADPRGLYGNAGA